MEGKRSNLSPRHLRKEEEGWTDKLEISSWEPEQLDCPCKRQSFSKSSDQISFEKSDKQTSKGLPWWCSG